MRWLSWLGRNLQYAALAPVPQAEAGLLYPSFSGDTAEDCEAFLAGRLAEYRMAHHQYVSVSDWTNLLAHGAESDLRGEVADANGKRRRSWDAAGSGEWREARRYLAAAVLGRVDSEEALRMLQRLVLVPLELGLAADSRWWGPLEWVTEVEVALVRYQPRPSHWEHRNPHTPT